MKEMEYESERALEWFTRLGSESICISTGNSQLNSLLYNGLHPCSITEVVGDCATGKTQLCFTIIAEMLLCNEKNDCYAVYLDFNGSFRLQRILQIMEARSHKRFQESEIKQMFSRVLVKRIHDSDELISALLELEGIAEFHTISILMVDSIGCMLSETAFTLRDGGYRTQVKVLEILRNLCNKHGITVLLVNNIVKWQDRITPSLGKRWKNNTAISHRIYLTRLPDLGIRYFEIEDKNPITRINFTISEKGFHEKEE